MEFGLCACSVKYRAYNANAPYYTVVSVLHLYAIFLQLSHQTTFFRKTFIYVIYISRDHLLNMSKIIKFQADLREIS